MIPMYSLIIKKLYWKYKMLCQHFKKILLPIDKSENSKRAINFVGNLISSFISNQIELNFLHIIRMDDLMEKFKNADFRLVMIRDRDFAEKLINKYINDNIIPFMNNYEKILRNKGFTGEVKKIVEQGDPGNKILEVAHRDNFQTIMIARRGISKFKKIILGSISNKLVYGLLNQNLYLVGQKISEETPISDILVPVDGSEYSMKAVEHAVCLAKLVKGIKKIVLLRVINISLYLERVKHGIDPEIEAEEILLNAKMRFLNTGISEDILQTKINVGIPAEEILKEACEGNYKLIIMGRKGRSELKDIILGGVSSAVINKCLEPTVAIINL